MISEAMRKALVERLVIYNQILMDYGLDSKVKITDTIKILIASDDLYCAQSAILLILFFDLQAEISIEEIFRIYRQSKNNRKKAAGWENAIRKSYLIDVHHQKTIKTATSIESVEKSADPVIVNAVRPHAKLFEGQIVRAVVTNVTASRIFLRIKGCSLPCSIYVGEVSDEFVIGLAEKFHVGLTIYAKVLAFDDTYGYQFSLKRITVEERLTIAKYSVVEVGDSIAVVIQSSNELGVVVRYAKRESHAETFIARAFLPHDYQNLLLIGGEVIAKVVGKDDKSDRIRLRIPSSKIM